MTHITLSTKALIGYIVVPHCIAALSCYHSINGIVIDFNTTHFNIWVVLDQKIVAELPFDQNQHGIDSSCNYSLYNLNKQLQNRNLDENFMKKKDLFWEEKKNSLHLSFLPTFIVQKLMEVVKDLSTEELKLAMNSIVVTGSFVTNQFLLELEKQISSNLNSPNFPFRVLKEYQISEKICVPHNPIFCSTIGALNYYGFTFFFYILLFLFKKKKKKREKNN